MIVELMRAWTPENMEGGECGICGREVEPLSVVTYAATDARTDMGRACESCIEYLGARSPEKCPTIEEYRELLRKYPEPMYASYDELKAASEADGYYEDPTFFVYDDSWIWLAGEKENAEHDSTPKTVLSAVNGYLSEAATLLSESFAPTDEEQEEEMKAGLAIAEAGMIVTQLMSRRERGEAVRAR